MKMTQQSVFCWPSLHWVVSQTCRNRCGLRQQVNQPTSKDTEKKRGSSSQLSSSGDIYAVRGNEIQYSGNGIRRCERSNLNSGTRESSGIAARISPHDANDAVGRELDELPLNSHVLQLRLSEIIHADAVKGKRGTGQQIQDNRYATASKYCGCVGGIQFRRLNFKGPRRQNTTLIYLK